MLRFLSIKRLAVIDAVQVEFGPGFNVLTGETGAGKSMLVEAVGLLLGGRASGDLVRTGEDSTVIDAIFERSGEELLLRREVTAQGRSRAFINGALATAGALKELSAGLIELHGQHEYQTLLDPATHLAVLDAFGGLDPWCAPVAAAFDVVRASADRLASTRREVDDRRRRQELLAFQWAEIDQAWLTPGEDDQLSATRLVLASAERVERLCGECYATLYESDEAVLARLGGIWRRVAELASLDARFQPYLDAREGIKSQLEDLALFLRRYADTIEASPARLQQVEERRALVDRLKRKYGPRLADVMARRDELRRELDDLEGSDERIGRLEEEHRHARAAYAQAAATLSEQRRKVAVDFARRLERLLTDLAMERTSFDVRFNQEPLPEPNWSASGVDAVEFFVSPNLGEELRPLARIVSGGELSRIMLAIKTLTFRARLAGVDGEQDEPVQRLGLAARSGRRDREVDGWGIGAPGLIFDEVDAGIGGRVAGVVGRKLRALGSAFQVLCITHLPQIAACADTHFLIDKRVERGRTTTQVIKLDEAGKVEELARMLGGEATSDGFRRSAREMLDGHRVPPDEYRVGESKPKGESERTKAKTRSGRV